MKYRVFVAMMLSMGSAQAVLGQGVSGQRCYVRNYSDAHLARHPEQTVRSMSFLVLPEVKSNGASFSFAISARVRGTQQDLYAFGACDWSLNEKGVLACTTDCDLGGFKVMASRPGRALLILGSDRNPGVLPFNSSCGGSSDVVNLNSGLDDKEFALEEGPLSECADMEAARFGSALPDQGSIVEEVSHRTWAISTTANCRVSSKTYRLNRAANDVTWANGNGNEDTEQVVSENGRVFETFTRASNHWGSAGEAPGIAWKYVGVNQNRIVVFRNGRHVYDLMACPAG